MHPKHVEEVEENEHTKMMESIQEMLENETLAYLSYLCGNVRTAFDFYFDMMQRSWIKGNKYKIFYWLAEALSNTELSVEQRELLKEEILNNVDMLVFTSTRYTKKIVMTFLPQCQTRIYEKLMGKPSLLLEYIETLLEDRDKNAPNNETLALYITLLCQLEPERVVLELKSHFYPIDEILDLCKLNKAYDAVAYISEKQGNFGEAIHLYSQIFLEECVETFEQILNGKINSQNYKNSNVNSQIIEKFSQLVKACEANMRVQSENQENIWMDMAVDVLTCKTLLDVNKRRLWEDVAAWIESRSGNFELVDLVFSDIIARLFIEISNHVSVKNIVSIIR